MKKQPVNEILSVYGASVSDDGSVSSFGRDTGNVLSIGACDRRMVEEFVEGFWVWKRLKIDCGFTMYVKPEDLKKALRTRLKTLKIVVSEELEKIYQKTSKKQKFSLSEMRFVRKYNTPEDCLAAAVSSGDFRLVNSYYKNELEKLNFLNDVYYEPNKEREYITFRQDEIDYFGLTAYLDMFKETLVGECWM